MKILVRLGYTHIFCIFYILLCVPFPFCRMQILYKTFHLLHDKTTPFIKKNLVQVDSPHPCEKPLIEGFLLVRAKDLFR